MGKPTTSERSPLKDAEGALRELNELSERFNNRLALGNLALAERYCDGRLNLLVEARWASIDFSIILRKGDTSELIGCPSIDHPRDRTSGAGTRAGSAVCGTEEDAGHAHFGPHLNGRGCYWRDSVVFVENIEHVDGVQNSVPSLVCFDRKDQRLCFGANAVYFSYATGFVSLGALVDRKVTSSVRLLPVRSYEIANEIVEDAPDIVDVREDIGMIRADVKESAGKISAINTSIATLETKVAALPTKGWGAAAVVISLTIIGGIVALAPKIQSWLWGLPLPKP